MRLIYADKLRKDVIDLPDPYNGFSDTYDKAYILDLVDEQPTVKAEPIRYGEWRADERSYTVGEAWCSVCKTEYNIDDLYNVGENNLPNYCPHCGALMDRGDT